MTNMNAPLTQERNVKRHSLRWLIFTVNVIESSAPSETGATPSLGLWGLAEQGNTHMEGDNTADVDQHRTKEG